VPGLKLTRQEVGSETAKFDLTLSIAEGPAGPKGCFEYNTDLFDSSTIDRMLGHFRTLLEGIVANPEQPISELPLLTQAEGHQLLVEWNDAKTDYPRDRCIHELFEEQAEKYPEAVAVVFEDQHLTYRELNRRANQLAHHLRTLGVGPEVLVGVCVERSVEMVVGLLGILKAGGAYVPLDTDYPKERLSFLLKDAQPSVLMTQKCLLEDLPEYEEAQVVCLDTDWEEIAQGGEENPISGARAENLAYAIYTSGSTGAPKGVMLTHGGLLNLVFWHQRAFAVTRADRATQVAGLAFDASVWELWPYLSAGASVHFPNEEIRLSPTQLREWLLSESITITFLPTVLAESILSLEWPEESALRMMLTGGEKIHRYPLDSTPLALVNNYGPTETTVVATSGVVSPTKARKQTDTTPAIGRPIANTRTYLLDQNLEPVPVGLPGELHIGGDGLARGYLNRPELTAEKFVPDPFSGEPGARLYRTGDLARYLPDGNIEFVGRLDHQVKIRGFRVEPGEVEAVLAQHPAVRETVMVAHENGDGDKRLVAYLTAVGASAPSVGELRGYLKEKLPEYMVPSAVIVLKELPLTSNGKVDRKALPMPDRKQPEPDRTFVPPRSTVEQTVAGIWEEVLGVARVGIHDDFFELGGHSLLATQVISRLREALQVELSLLSLFDAPTIAELAFVVQSHGEQRDDGDVDTINRTSQGNEEQLLAKLGQLSDEDVASLLSSMLAEEDAAE
jgi:amino acid adenylation domain-containing protein